MERDPALEAVFMPVRPPSTFEETVERLGTAIRLGLLAPGSRLPPERELACELGISRSTLRQALATLVRSGHLVSLRGRTGGTFVAEAPPLAERGPATLGQGAWEVLEYRVAIECGAVVLAAERGGGELERLEGLVEKMTREHGDLAEYHRSDVRFHIGLAEAAGSPRLIAAMTDVQGQMADLLARIPRPAEMVGTADDQHRALLEALRQGDAARAVKVAREHMESTEHVLTGVLPPRPAAPLAA